MVLTSELETSKKEHGVKEHGDKVKAALEKLSKYQGSLPRLLQEVLPAGEGLYPLDFVAMAIVKRALSIASAFETLVNDWNMVCARAILRLQVDTAIRFSAFWLSDNPHEMAMEVMRGKRIDKMKDRDGNNMTDAYLVKKLSSEFSWMPKVYETTSGYIHFSEAHIFAPITRVENNGIFECLMNSMDEKFPEASWHEIVSCFNNCTEIILSYLEGYKHTKNAFG